MLLLEMVTLSLILLIKFLTDKKFKDMPMKLHLSLRALLREEMYNCLLTIQ